MQAIISDIRRGDRFTWNGGKYIAVDDARPWQPTTSSDADPMSQLAFVSAVKDTGQQPGADGVIDVSGSGSIGQNIWQHAPVEITERGVDVTWFGQEDEAFDSPDEARRLLRNITMTRETAQRAVDDVDVRRDRWIRGAILSEVPVAEIAEITSLSRSRVYQIRDGRR